MRVAVHIQLAPAHAELAKSVVGEILLPVQGNGAVLQEQGAYGRESFVVEIRHVDAADFRPQGAAQGSNVVSVKS